MSGSNFTLSHRWWYAAIAVLVVIASYAVQNMIRPYGMDFISYWAAAKLTLAGDAAAAYDQAVHRAVAAAAVNFEGQMPFPYPPPYLFLTAPFGLLDFPIAAALWIALLLVLWGVTIYRVFPGLLAPALAFPPILVCGIIGQNGALTAVLMILGLYWLPKRPFVAGLMFGCVALKPQLACLIPIALLAGREWRAIGGAITSFTGLAIASLIVFGLPAWQGFFGILPLYGTLAADGLVGWQRIASLYAAMRILGAPELLAATVHAVIAVVSIAMLWRTWSRPGDWLHRAAILVTATALISPYIYMYDHAMLFVAIVWAIRSGVSQRAIAVLYLVSFAGFVQMALPGIGVNVMALTPIVLFVLLIKAEIKRRAPPVAHASALHQA